MEHGYRLIVVCALVLVGCGPSTDDGSSELKWGHLPTSAGSGNWLTNVGPQDEIELCGSDTSYLEVAVRRWAEPLGRAKYLKVVPCGKGTRVKSKIKFATEQSVYPCDQRGVQGATDPNSGTMNICKNLQAPIKYVIVHETGHMWGMCDMYAGGESRCDSKHKTVVDNTAIMGNGSVGDDPALTKDDIEGIKAMGNRSEFASVNKAWADFLANNPDSNTGGGTNGDTSGPGNGADIFIHLGEPNGSELGEVAIATAPTATLARVGLCKGNKTACTSPGAQWLNIQFTRSTGANANRAYFTSSKKLNQSSLQGELTMVALDAGNQVLNAATVQIGGQ